MLVCDFVDSPQLSGQPAPEKRHAVIHTYQNACADVVKRFEGQVQQYLDAGLLVYFGYPSAHEDEPQRAVRAGLEIIHQVQDLSATLPQPLQVRIGLHTGPVVIGESSQSAREIAGGTPDIAARLLGRAEPNTVLISPSTHKLVEGYFPCRDLGSQPLTGLAAPVHIDVDVDAHIYQVLGEGAPKSRIQRAIQKGLTPLVGRDEELGLLRQRWQLAKAGNGQVVVICGEAGIGKSRLIQAFKEEVADEHYARIECHCSPYAQHSAWYPAIDYLQRRLASTSDESAADKLCKLEGLLDHYSLPLQETVPLLASLLSLPLPEERYPPLSLTPERQKQKTEEALLALPLADAEHQPVCLIGEDLHWIDPSTLEYITQLIDRIATTRFLILLTCRTEFQPTWGKPPHLNAMQLKRLSAAQVHEMVPRIRGGELLDAEVTQQLAVRSNGVPLFVEELTKMIVEADTQRVGQEPFFNEELSQPLTIPSSLQDLLMARLDRLGTAKELAQIGATLGREFSYNLIKAAADMDEVVLQSSLNTLVTAELLQKRDRIPRARYQFRHTLIQEAAYQSLLKSKRQQYHQQIAGALEEQFPETAEAQPELLAHHLTEANIVEKAIVYWQKAGEAALQKSANDEAIVHISKGLELLQPLPGTLMRDQQELMLQMTLGVPLMATKGYAAPEVKRAYDRARELCQQVGETLQLVPVLRGLSLFYYVRAELETAQQLSEQILGLVQHQQDSSLLVEAHQGLGSTLSSQGEFTRALHHFKQGHLLYDPIKHPAYTVHYGQDPGVVCLTRAAQVLWFLGYPDQALEKNQKALALAKKLSHPHSLAYALNFSAALQQLRLEPYLAQEQADAAVELSSRYGFPIWEAMGTILRGWSLARQGRMEEGIVQLCDGLASWREVGAEIARPPFLALLAEAYGKKGQLQKGLQVLDEALLLGVRTGEQHYEAELYRLKGEFLLGLKDQDQREQDRHEMASSEAAEECFREAIVVARLQEAKSLELRAIMSLARLWDAQGKKDVARQLLAEIYAWFSEGLETADLKEAQLLLEALS